MLTPHQKLNMSTSTSTSLSTAVPKLYDPNYLTWAPLMKNFLHASGLWWVITRPCPMDSSEESTTTEDDWDNDNDKALGHMLLKIEIHLADKWQSKYTAKEIWDGLEAQFSKTPIYSIYAEFKAMMDTVIPENNHPLPSFTKLAHHFARLKEYKYV